MIWQPGRTWSLDSKLADISNLAKRSGEAATDSGCTAQGVYRPGWLNIEASACRAPWPLHYSQTSLAACTFDKVSCILQQFAIVSWRCADMEHAGRRTRCGVLGALQKCRPSSRCLPEGGVESSACKDAKRQHCKLRRITVEGSTQCGQTCKFRPTNKDQTHSYALGSCLSMAFA